MTTAGSRNDVVRCATSRPTTSPAAPAVIQAQPKNPVPMPYRATAVSAAAKAASMRLSRLGRSRPSTDPAFWRAETSGLIIPSRGPRTGL